MNTFMAAARDFVRDEEGITAIEYGLIAAVMAGAIGGIFLLLEDGLTTAFTAIKTKLTTP